MQVDKCRLMYTYVFGVIELKSPISCRYKALIP
nr:MAG TPA: hypothetical protein [Caudoviricetes sp.]